MADFDGILPGHKHRQILDNALTVVLVTRVALPVSNSIRKRITQRTSSRREHVTCLIVSNVNYFRLRIADRVVVPRSKSVRLTVSVPRESESTFGHQCSERLVSDH